MDFRLSFNFYVGWRQINAIYKRVLGATHTPQKVWVLEALDEESLISMVDLSRQLHLDQSAVSLLISRLENQNLVRRLPGYHCPGFHEIDRRTVVVKLTHKGGVLREQLREKYPDLDKKLHQSLRLKDATMTERIAQQLEKNSESGFVTPKGQ